MRSSTHWPMVAAMALVAACNPGGDDTGSTNELPSPVVHYRFDSCTASSPEEGGTGFDATLGGDATCTGDTPLSEALGSSWSSGTALSCDGAEDYGEVAHRLALAPEAFTLAAWVRIQEGDPCFENTCAVLSKANSDTSSKGYWVSINTGVRLAIHADGQEVDIAGSTQVPSGSWHHVAATFDGAVGRVFLDGSGDGSSAVPAGIVYGDEPFLICAMTGRIGEYDFPGLVDEVRLFDTALEAEQVAALYESYTNP